MLFRSVEGLLEQCEIYQNHRMPTAISTVPIPSQPISFYPVWYMVMVDACREFGCDVWR